MPTHGPSMEHGPFTVVWKPQPGEQDHHGVPFAHYAILNASPVGWCELKILEAYQQIVAANSGACILLVGYTSGNGDHDVQLSGMTETAERRDITRGHTAVRGLDEEMCITGTPVPVGHTYKGKAVFTMNADAPTTQLLDEHQEFRRGGPVKGSKVAVLVHGNAERLTEIAIHAMTHQGEHSDKISHIAIVPAIDALNAVGRSMAARADWRGPHWQFAFRTRIPIVPTAPVRVRAPAPVVDAGSDTDTDSNTTATASPANTDASTSGDNE